MADNLIIKIGANASEYQKEIDKISGSTKDLEGQLGSIAAVSATIFAGVVAAAGFAIAKFKETEEITNTLTLALRNQGLDADALSKKYDTLAKAVSAKTKFDDDQVKSGLAVLQTFVGQEEISGDLAKALVDLSAKTGDVDSAAQLLGRAINGNTAGLKKQGIEIEDNATRSERLAQIINGVSGSYGDLAEQQAKGLGGLNLVKKAFDDLAKAIGEKLAPIVSDAAVRIANFINAVSKNEVLLTLIVAIGKFVAILTGVIAGVAGVSLAIIKLNQVFQITSAVIRVLGLSVKGLVAATGLGLLLIIATEIYLNWDKLSKIFPKVAESIENMVAVAKALLPGFGSILLGVFQLASANVTGGIKSLKDGVAQLKQVFTEGVKEVAAVEETEGRKREDAATKRQKDAAAKRRAEQQRIENAELASRSASLQAQQLQIAKFGQETIDLKKKEGELQKQLAETSSAEQIAILQAQLDENQRLQAQALVDDTERQRVFQEEILANNEAYNSLSAEQKQVFLDQNQLQLQAALDTELAAREKLTKDTAKIETDARNKNLQERIKYGATLAAIDEVLNSKQVAGAQQAAGALVGLQQSKSAELRAIGKAAAITQITIGTAEAAISAYKGTLAFFSFLGPFANIPAIAAAGAASAFGGEQIANVIAAQRGGVVPGTNLGGDSIPMIAQPGEFITPRSNFDEVINAVANQRAATSAEGSSGVSTGGGGGGTEVTTRLEFSGDQAEKFLTARQVEARSLGTLREARGRA